MGNKIKTLACTLIVISILVCTICFFIGLTKYTSDKRYIEYATANGGAYGYPSLEKAGNNAYAGKMLMTYGGSGIIASFLGGLPLYWFGCMFEKIEDIQSVTYENKRKIEEMQRKLEE